MRYVPAAAALLACLSASPVLASRAELDGRGLPRLLAVDPSLVRRLPASASVLEPQALVDYHGSDAFVLALGGRGARYGYFLDGNTHNLLLALSSGWGITLGYSETYAENQFHDFYEGSTFAREEFTRSENERRELRMGLGWRHTRRSGRVFEAGVGGSYLDWDNESGTLRITDEGPEEETTGGWSSDIALGVDATVRSVSPGPGLQVAAHFSYADLKPKTKTPFAPGVERRRASLDVAWRFTTAPTDDLVLGFTSDWRTDTDLTITAGSLYLFEARERETKLGSLGFFLSGEREVLENLRVRGGVRGLATFRDVEDTRNLITVDYDSYRTTGTFTAGIDSPDFFLGTGYRWKSLTFDVRLRESIDLDSPFLHWSVGMRF